MNRIETGCIVLGTSLTIFATNGCSVDARRSLNGTISSEMEQQAESGMRQDGFIADVDGSRSTIKQGGTVSLIAQLTVGECVAPNVFATGIVKNNEIVDVTDYKLAVGTIGQGKFQRTSLTISFENADGFQKALQEVHCLP